MGLGVCHECGVMLWCSIKDNEFYNGKHAQTQRGICNG